jgi:nitrate/nitrite-specific signal transduction histidine kinase
MGIQVMKYRANLIGGQLAIHARKRGGVEVFCRVAKHCLTP